MRDVPRESSHWPPIMKTEDSRLITAYRSILNRTIFIISKLYFSISVLVVPTWWSRMENQFLSSIGWYRYQKVQPSCYLLNTHRQQALCYQYCQEKSENDHWLSRDGSCRFCHCNFEYVVKSTNCAIIPNQGLPKTFLSVTFRKTKHDSIFSWWKLKRSTCSIFKFIW